MCWFDKYMPVIIWYGLENLKTSVTQAIKESK